MSDPFRSLAVCEKPREKFLRHGPSAVTDQDLLAILLRTGTKGQSVLDVSRQVLHSLPGENICYLSDTSIGDLCQIPASGRIRPSRSVPPSSWDGVFPGST